MTPFHARPPADAIPSIRKQRTKSLLLSIRFRRTGFSMNTYVAQANNMLTMTAVMRTLLVGVSPPLMILAIDSKGQCHRYSGKLINPNHTSTRFERTTRFSYACAPAEIISTAPSIGNAAHQPGKGVSLVMTRTPIAIRTAPSTDWTLCSVLPFASGACA
jgi:hypothetical protein